MYSIYVSLIPLLFYVISSWSVPTDLNGPDQASQGPPLNTLPVVPGAHFSSALELSPCLSDTTGAQVSSPALPGNGPCWSRPQPPGRLPGLSHLITTNFSADLDSWLNLATYPGACPARLAQGQWDVGLDSEASALPAVISSIASDSLCLTEQPPLCIPS